MLVRPQPIGSTTSTTTFFVQKSSSAGNDLPTNRSKQGYEVFQCDRPAYLIALTYRFLPGLKNEKFEKEMHHTPLDLCETMG